MAKLKTVDADAETSRTLKPGLHYTFPWGTSDEEVKELQVTLGDKFEVKTYVQDGQTRTDVKRLS